MTYKQSSMTSSTTPQSQTLGLLHRDSRTITKVQPKIRIIHIYAPEIIKTDVANFRELVQRLTGKPSPSENGGKGFKGMKGKNKGKKVNRELSYNNDNNNNEAVRGRIGCDKSSVNTKLEVMMGPSITTTTITGSSSSPSSSCDHHQQQHEHQEFWRTTTVDHTNTTSGGFLSAFTDLDDNFDLSMFNMAAADAPSHHHLNSFEEAAQLSFRG